MSLKDSYNLKIKNLIWAMSEDYSIDFPDKNLINNRDTFDLFNLSYALSLDYKLIFDYMHHLSNSDQNHMFLDLFFIGLEAFAMNKMKEKRLSYEDYKNLFYSKINNFYKFHKRNNLIDELRYTRSQRFFSEVPKTTQMVKNLDDKINDLSLCSNASELIDSFEDILDKYFFFTSSIKEKSNNKAREKFDKSKLKKSNKKFEKDVLDQYYGLIGSAEFTNELNLDDLELDEEDKKNLLKLDEKEDKKNKIHLAQNLFGNNFLNNKDLKSLENDICTGNHKSSKIIISKGLFSNNLEANFRKSQLQESLEDNQYYLNRFKNLFSRSKNRMNKSLKNSLTILNENTSNKSKYGIINSRLIYRKKYLNDDYIFNKTIKTESPQISVDILIDGSASQLDRKSKISSWTYTITESLTDLKIPTRVMTFSNLENYLGLTIFREYNDPKEKNLEILKYSPAGSNRDGLAFRLIRRLLSKNQYKEKIFIYLTDGKPYDVRIRVDNDYKEAEKPYKEKYAEIDTAIEFRKLEEENIYPLAIFTGKEKDLKSMRHIYGNNFAFIKDINRFASLITQYINKIIKT